MAKWAGVFRRTASKLVELRSTAKSKWGWSPAFVIFAFAFVFVFVFGCVFVFIARRSDRDLKETVEIDEASKLKSSRNRNIVNAYIEWENDMYVCVRGCKNLSSCFWFLDSVGVIWFLGSLCFFLKIYNILFLKKVGRVCVTFSGGLFIIMKDWDWSFWVFDFSII